MDFYLLILLRFILSNIIKPGEFNPIGDKFDPLKTVIIFLSIIFMAYTITITLNYLTLNEFLKEYYPDVFIEVEVYKEKGIYKRVVSSNECVPLERTLKIKEAIKK